MGFTAVLNGNLYDITSMSVSLAGTPITRGVFSELNWKVDQAPGKFEGNSVRPAGYTLGHGSASGSFKMLISYFDDFAKQITDLGFPSYVGVDFDVTVTFLVNQFGPTPANDTRTVNLQGMRITGLAENTAGTDALMAECDVIVHNVETNGLTAFGGEDDVSPF